MPADNYILSFDFAEITRQISNLQQSYVDLAKTQADHASKSRQELDLIEEQVSRITSSLDNSFQNLDKYYTGLFGKLETTIDYFKNLETYSKNVTENLKSLNNVDLANLGKSGGETISERLAEVSPGEGPGDFMSMDMSIRAGSADAAEGALAKAEAAIKAAKEAVIEANKAKGIMAKTSEAMSKKIQQELKNAKRKVGGMFSGATGGALAGGGMAGMIGLILLGTQESQRKGAEASEMFNVLAAGGDVFDKETKRASKWFARFGEHAQAKMGIGRKAIQGLNKQLIDIGLKGKDLLKDYGKEVDDVSASVTSTTLALDLMFQKGIGSSMTDVTTLVKDYGDELGEATEKYKRLNFEAQRSEIGVGRFVGAVMEGTAALSQYGIEMEDTTEVMRTMVGYYKEMGLDKEVAGTFAGEATKGLMQGVGNMSFGMTAQIAQTMRQDQGLPVMDALGARQWFKEGAQRVSEGEDTGFSVRAIKAIHKFITNRVGGGRPAQIMFAEQEMGMENAPAAAFIDRAGKLAAGVKIDELTPEEQKAHKKQFERQSDTLTDLQKNQYDLIQSLAKIGSGLIKILTSILGVLIAGIQGLPILITAAIKMLTGDAEEKQAGRDEIKLYKAVMEAQVDTFTSGASDIWEGTKGAGGVLMDAFSGVPSLKKAMDMKSSWGDMGNLIADKVEAGLAPVKQGLIDVQMSLANFIGLSDDAKHRIRTDNIDRGPVGSLHPSFQKTMDAHGLSLGSSGKPKSSNRSSSAGDAAPRHTFLPAKTEIPAEHINKVVSILKEKTLK